MKQRANLRISRRQQNSIIGHKQQHSDSLYLIQRKTRIVRYFKFLLTIIAETSPAEAHLELCCIDALGDSSVVALPSLIKVDNVPDSFEVLNTVISMRN